MVVAEIPTDALVVFVLIGVALVLFVSELIPNDMTAVGIIVALAVLEPVTGVTSRDALSGFANTATITIVAMYMLSAGIQRTGIVQRLGYYLARYTRGSEKRALTATVVTTGPIAGFINNTPVVAVFIPMISDLAKQSGISPSKLLLPLSYAAILGGTLTLIGTSTNLLASEFAVTLLDRGAIGMFEFSALGLVIFAVGIAYLLTIGRWLTPARIPADADLIEEFNLENHLTKLRVRADSPVAGMTAKELEAEIESDVRILQIRRERAVDNPESEPTSSESDPVPAIAQLAREEETFVAAATDRELETGDVLTVHGNVQEVNRFRERYHLRQLTRELISEETFDESSAEDLLAKALVPDGSPFAGKTLSEARLKQFHRTSVLAVRRGDELFRQELDTVELQAGDLLLVQTVPSTLEYFSDTGDLIPIDDEAVTRLSNTKPAERTPLSPKMPIALAIMAGVVATAALGVAPIVITALAGVFLMVVSGCLNTSEAYDAVSWNVIFLLAGVIPLGIALEETAGSQLIANGIVASEAVLPLVGVLFLFCVVTGFLANLITPVATVVLMIPVAIDAAATLSASGFSFLLAVMFASATSFTTPVGYQTNLMVYGPGGYAFTDFVKVGAPLQVLLAVVTTVGIVVLWGL